MRKNYTVILDLIQDPGVIGIVHIICKELDSGSEPGMTHEI